VTVVTKTWPGSVHSRAARRSRWQPSAWATAPQALRTSCPQAAAWSAGQDSSYRSITVPPHETPQEQPLAQLRRRHVYGFKGELLMHANAPPNHAQ